MTIGVDLKGSLIAGDGFPDALLPPPDADPVTWRMIAAAIAQHENGPHTIDSDAMLRGWEAAK